LTYSDTRDGKKQFIFTGPKSYLCSAYCEISSFFFTGPTHFLPAMGHQLLLVQKVICVQPIVKFLFFLLYQHIFHQSWRMDRSVFF